MPVRSEDIAISTAIRSLLYILEHHILEHPLFITTGFNVDAFGLPLGQSHGGDYQARSMHLQIFLPHMGLTQYLAIRGIMLTNQRGKFEWHRDRSSASRSEKGGTMINFMS
jgi:hypothetical protein